MKPIRPIIAIIAAILLFSFYRWDVKYVERARLTELQGAQVLYQDPSNAIALEFHVDDTVIRLERVDPASPWQMLEPIETLAANSIVNAYLENMRGARRQARFPAKNLESYGLAEPARSVSVTLMRENGKETKTILFGTQLGEFGNVYSMVEGEDEVFTVSEWFYRQSGKTVDSLRDKTVHRVDLPSLTALRIDGPRHEFSVEREDSNSNEWSLKQEGREPIPADRNIVERNLQGLSQGQFVQVFDNPTTPVGQLGLNGPLAVVSANGQEVLRVGSPIADREQFYARADGETIGILGANQVQDFFRPPLEWGTKRLVWMERDGIVELETQSGSNLMKLEKTDRKWVFEDSPEAALRQDTLDTLLDGIYTLGALQLVSADATAEELEQYGFRAESFRAVVRDTEGNEQGFRFGRTDAREGVTYTLRLQDNSLWRVDFLGQKNVFKFRGDLLDRRLEPNLLDRTARFEVVSAEQGTMVVEKKDKNWTATLPGGQPVPVGPLSISPYLVAVQDLEMQSEMLGESRRKAAFTLKFYEEKASEPFLTLSEISSTRQGTLLDTGGKQVEVPAEQYNQAIAEMARLTQTVMALSQAKQKK